VTVDRSRFPHQEGSNEALTYNLPQAATSVKVALISETGEVALEKDIGPQKAGENTFAWDGLKTNTLPAKSGTYMLRVEAKDDRGMAMDTAAQSRARVVGVSFEGSEPVFLIGDAKTQAKVTMKNIIRIDDAGMGISATTVAPSASGSAQNAGQESAIQPVVSEPKKPNFIAFQKGVGSSNLDPDQASKEAAEALARYESQNVAPQNGEKGFPNGLHD
jgi:hypothetical protein